MILIQPSCMSVKTHANFANWDKLLHATATHCSMLTSVWLIVNLHQSNDWQWQIEKRSSYIVWVVTRPDNYQIVSHFLVILIVHNLIFSTFLIHDLSENICRWLALNLFLSGLSPLTLMIRQQQCRPLALSYPSVQPDTVVAYATTEIINEIKHLLKWRIRQLVNC